MFKSDIEIAQEAKLEHIREVAAKIGVTEDELEDADFTDEDTDSL